MTDTTDIKALRELLCHENKESDHHIGVTVTTLRLLLSKADQLEAERQRADDRAKENYRNKCDVDNCMETIANLESELEAERQRADDLQRINGIQETTIEVFRHKELAALKGDQVPVGKFAGWGLYRADTDSFGNWLKDNPREETDQAIAKNGYVNVRLFTATQKPVVLPINEMSYKDACEFVSINGMRNEDRQTLAMRVWNSCRKAAIEAAGGIVKDGE